MNDEQEDAHDDETDFDTIEDAEESPVEEQSNPPRRRGGGLVWVVLVVGLLALAGGGYYWQKSIYQRDLDTLRGDVASVRAAQNQVSANVGATTGRIDAQNDEIAAASQSVSAIKSKVDATQKAQEDLRRSVSALYEKETQTSVDWVLAEAEYLVLAATQRLALEHDVHTAIAALRAADQRLRSVEHPDLIPIREQLIADIAALEAVSLPDIEGLAIYLAKAIDQVDGLPTKPLAEEVTPFSSVREGDFNAEDWRRLLHAMWSDLTELVDVKDSDLPDSVLFDPELRYFLRQNLKLELASARLSVLRRDSANLTASAELITKLFEAYYDVEDSSVKNMLQRLAEAKSTELNPAMPNISGSLDVVRQHREASAVNLGDAQ